MHLAAVLFVPTQDAVGDPAMQMQFSKQTSSLLLLRYRLSSLLFCHSIPKLSNWTIHNIFPLYKLLLPALHCTAYHQNITGLACREDIVPKPGLFG
jgi:hypothetical protein